MNSRRLTSGMGSPPEPAMAAYRTLRLPWKRRQVLGVDLNRSESPRVGDAPTWSSRSVLPALDLKFACTVPQVPSKHD